jgi:hypothetical protein
MSEHKSIDPHPWYLGGCDALGPFETCSECNKLINHRYTAVCLDSKNGNKIWDVVGPLGILLGRSYENRVDAKWIAEILSIAYEAGETSTKFL